MASGKSHNNFQNVTRNLVNVIAALILILSLLAQPAPARAAGRIYVAVNGYSPPDGTVPGPAGKSWADAYTDLQDALNTAQVGDEIWVAAGTYKPTGADGARTVTFQLKSSVAVYGGFAGGEVMLTTRDPAANLTILSGDLSGENSYHVVTVASGVTDATLDGFIITAGNAYDSGAVLQGGGGGIYNLGSPTLSNITFSANSAVDGGGMYNASGSPTLTNVTFRNNQASGNGGGLYNASGSPTLTNVTFSANTASGSGGGVYNNAGSPTLTNVTFKGNTATNSGGGLYSSTTVYLKNSILWGDSNGSGTVSEIAGTASVTHSIVEDGFSGASSADPLLGTLGNYGGSMQTYPLLPGSSAINGTGANCPAKDQRGVARGTTCDIGAFESQGFALAISTGDWQAATVNNLYSTPLKVVVTAVDPLEPVQYGNVTFTPPTSSAATVHLTGSVDNLGNVELFGPSTIQIGAGGIASDTAMASPDFGAFTVIGTTRGASSPAVFNLINTEETPGLVIYVNASAIGGNNGSSWDDAYPNLQSALVSAASEQKIWVRKGTYKPTTGSDKTATFMLKSGVAVYGGFAGGEVLLTARNPLINLTTLSGDLNGDDGTNFANNSENSYHVVTNASGVTDATLDGFTISGGNAIGASPHPDGGGMYNAGNPTLANLTFSGNKAVNGGGLLSIYGDPTLTNITFSTNLATNGGGMYNDGDPTLTDITFSDNQADNGGGFFNNPQTPILINVTFSGNHANNHGGGMFNVGTPTLTNATFYANTSTNKGGAVYSMFWLYLKNSILWGDKNGSGDVSEIFHSGPTIVSNSIVQGGVDEGEINVAPLLGTLGSYGGSTQTIPLLPGSPAIGGSSADCPAEDQRGVARGATCDIGAYESGGFNLSIEEGDGQSASVGTAFAKALKVAVTATKVLEPVAGGKVTFTSPASGASAVLSTSLAVIGSDGNASVTATANGTSGSYSVSASTAGASSSLNFDLTNVNTSVTTGTATSVTATGATLNATVNADNDSATVTFEYGLTTGYGETVSATPGTVSGSDDTSVSKAITGLTPNSTYHFRVKAVNSFVTINGADQSFKTLDSSASLVFHDAAHNPILSVALGERLHPQAAVTGTGASIPTGSVSFMAYQNTSCSGQGNTAGSAALDVSGQADPSLDLSMTSNGLSFKAHYGGDANYTAGDSPCAGISTSPYLSVLITSSSTRPADGAQLSKSLSSLLVQFNQDALHNSKTLSHSATNPVNFLLVSSGQDGEFDTLACGPEGTGGLKPDDVQISVESVYYNEETYLATVKVNHDAPLHNGEYRLFICGTTSITDPGGTRYLNNHEADSIITFMVAVPAGSEGNDDDDENRSKLLPKSGFAPGIRTLHPPQPESLVYSGTGMRLEIPSLGVSQPVQGVPQSSGWDVTWLGDAIGYLQGTAFPTWNGNSVLTGHATTSEGKPGPFAELGALKWGDQVILHAWGQEYVYEIRTVDLWVRPDATGTITRHESLPWLTLITCRGYDAQTDSFRWRTVARAVLVSVR